MKKTTAKIITISDLIQWNEKHELELSPRYQRNSVWNDKAKAYLIDTIVRGLPIPPIFMRQQVDVATKTTRREIIDGQQRVRAIIEYVVSEAFPIKKSHNKELGGKYYSDLDADIQEMLLEYEILAEVVTEKDDSIIYDMFARLNSNNIVLNKQEIRNSKYWGEFKVLAYRLASRYRDFFLENGLFGDNDCARMRDLDLINSMINLALSGIVAESPTSIDNLYANYDKDFDEADDLERKLNKTMDVLKAIYSYFNGNLSCFGNKNYFFTLYAVVYNQMYGIVNENLTRIPTFHQAAIEDNIDCLKSCIAQFMRDYEFNLDDKANHSGLYAEYTQFVGDHKSRTTSKAERLRRISFLNNAIVGNL